MKKALNINNSIWVSASAGTGKTTILVNRLLSLLINGVDISKILCITYTKTAAAEMKDRIYKILSKWVVMSDEELKKDIKEKLLIEDEVLFKDARILFAKIIDNVDNLKIFTIHSFCQQIISRFPLEAGIYPNFELIDEYQSKLMIKDIINKVICDESINEDFNNIILENSEDNFMEKITDIVYKRKDICEDIRYYEEKLKLLLDIEIFDQETLDENFLNRDFNNLNILKNYAVNNLTDKQIETFSEIDSLLENKDISKYLSVFLTQENTIKTIYKRLDKNEDMKSLYEEEAIICQNYINNKYKIDIYKLSLSSLKIALKVINEYKIEKTKRSVLDFDDLLMITYKLLENTEYSSWVNYKLDNGLEHLMLDEAQDTSFLQWKIIEKLTEDFFAGETRSERKRTIFVVGDEKQSIYKFQGANPEMFEEEYKNYKNLIDSSDNGFEKIKLENSYRSLKEILFFVDNTFKNNVDKISRLEKKIEHNAVRNGVGYIELWPLIEIEEDEEDMAWTLNLNDQSDSSKKYSLLSKYIVNQILQLVNSNRAIITRNGEKRKIQFGDIMILFKNRTKHFIQILISELNKNKIPNSGSDRIDLFENIIVRDILSLLTFIVFNNDDLSLANIIKSPILNLNEEDLFNLSIYKNENKTTLFEALKEYNIEKYNFLLDIIDKSNKCGIYDLVYYIIENIKQNIINRAGEDFLFILEKFYDFVRNYENNYSSSIVSFLTFINSNSNDIKKDIDLNGNYVKIMTCHASKGLQSPIIFLAEATTEDQTKKEKYFWYDNIPLYRVNQKKYTIKNVVLDNVKEAINNASYEEYFRLLYVALTRAENELYICGFKKKNKKSEEEPQDDTKQKNWYDIIKNTMLSINAKEVPFDFDDSNKKFVFGERSYIDTFSREITRKKSNRNIFKNVKKYEETKEEIKIITPSQFFDHVDRDKIFTTLDENVLRGKAIHKLLEILPNTKNKDKVADVYLNNMFTNITNKKEIKDKAINIINNFQEFFNNKSKAEVPIIGKDEEGNYISGKIDRLIEYNDRIVILDYKNTKKCYNEKNLPEPYLKQLELYKKVLSKIYKNKKIECYILLTSYSKLLKINN